MFSQTVEYAFRAVVFLARQGEGGSTTKKIAEGTQVPQAYLSKVLQSLSRGGVVRSQRGVGGGIFLAKSAEETSLLDIVNAVDPITRIELCPLGFETDGGNLCLLHDRLDETLAGVESAFRATKLSDIVDARGHCHPNARCAFPLVDVELKTPN